MSLSGTRSFCCDAMPSSATLLISRLLCIQGSVHCSFFVSVWRTEKIYNKHNCVLSNADLSNVRTKTGMCTFLKSSFYFRFHSPLNTKSTLLNFICTWALVLICWKMWCSEPESCRNPNPHTLKLANYFRFVSQRTDVNATTFMSCMQNLVQIGKELWT